MPAISRRTMLAATIGGSAAFLAGCAPSDLPIIGRSDPDENLRLATATSEQDLIDAYRAVAERFRPLAAPLGVLREQHERHLRALLEGVDEQPPASTAPAPDLRTRAAALRSLRRLESGAARQRAQACVDAEAAEVIELMARIGAAEAAHVAALGELAQGAPT